MLLHDRRPHSSLWRVHRRLMQHRRYATVHYPGVAETRRGMVMKQERQNFSVPDRLALELLYDVLPRE